MDLDFLVIENLQIISYKDISFMDNVFFIF